MIYCLLGREISIRLHLYLRCFIGLNTCSRTISHNIRHKGEKTHDAGKAGYNGTRAQRRKGKNSTKNELDYVNYVQVIHASAPSVTKYKGLTSR
jgi:hypothetical protein